MPRKWKVLYTENYKTLLKEIKTQIIDGNVNWCSHCGKQYGDSSKKLKIELQYDPAIPSWDYTQTKLQFDRIHAPLCS